MDSHKKTNLKLEVHKRVAFEDLHWDCVHERLAVRTKHSGLIVDLLIKQFVSHFFSSLRRRWLNSVELAQGDNLVAIVICECHGCDEITIERNSKIFIGIGNVPVFQALRFRIQHVAIENRASEGRATTASLKSGLVKVGPKRIAYNLRSNNNLIFFYAFCAIFGAIFYALAGILVVYAIAVFLQFLSHPGEVTIIATQRADIGIALLSLLVGLAALSGRFLKRIIFYLFKERK